MQTQLGQATFYLAEKPHETFKICQTALNQRNSAIALSADKKNEWQELQKKAEAGILEKRRTNPSYASDIILSEIVISPVSISQRNIQHENANTAAALLPSNSKKSGDALEKAVLLYQEYIEGKMLHKAFLLCKKQLELLKLENNQIELTDKKLQKELWLRLNEHCTRRAWLIAEKQSYHLLQSLEILRELQDPKQNCINLLIFFTHYSSVKNILIEIYNKEKSFLQSFQIELEKAIKDSPQKIKDFLNPPQRTRIDWDRFAKFESDVSVFLSIIDPDQFPELYKKVSEGHKKIESQTKYKFLYSISTTLVLALGIAIELYRENFLSVIYISAPIFTFMYGLLFLLAYCKISLQLDNESFLFDIKTYLDWQETIK